MIYVSTYAPESANHTNRRQREHMLGRTLLKVGLQREYALFLSELSLETGDYGKPYLVERPDIHFNISHCDGMVVCGLWDREIGVDVERVRPYSQLLEKKIFSEEEREAFDREAAACGKDVRRFELFFRSWTLKESFLKAIGTGISSPMRDITFTFEGAKIRSNRPEFTFYQTCLYGIYMISVCVSTNPQKRSSQKRSNQKREKEISCYDVSGSI